MGPEIGILNVMDIPGGEGSRGLTQDFRRGEEAPRELATLEVMGSLKGLWDPQIMRRSSGMVGILEIMERLTRVLGGRHPAIDGES